MTEMWCITPSTLLGNNKKKKKKRKRERNLPLLDTSNYPEPFTDSAWAILLCHSIWIARSNNPSLIRMCENSLRGMFSPNFVYAFLSSAFVQVNQRSSRPPSHFPRSNSLTWQTIIKEKQMDGLRHPPNDISRWLGRRERQKERGGKNSWRSAGFQTESQNSLK